MKPFEVILIIGVALLAFIWWSRTGIGQSLYLQGQSDFNRSGYSDLAGWNGPADQGIDYSPLLSLDLSQYATSIPGAS